MSLSTSEICLLHSYPCLYQKPRSEEEETIFQQSIELMGDLYFSAVGTTVLQLPSIPQRPPRFDGALRLENLARKLDKIDCLKELSRIGELQQESWTEQNGTVMVKFVEHEDAVKLVKLLKEGSLPKWRDLLGTAHRVTMVYNETVYNKRGW